MTHWDWSMEESFDCLKANGRWLMVLDNSTVSSYHSSKLSVRFLTVTSCISYRCLWKQLLLSESYLTYFHFERT